MTRMNLLLVSVLLTALVSLRAAEAPVNATKARQALDSASYAHFAKEIKDRYPRDVAAYAIVEATVSRILIDAYCPRRGALCGANPSCKHNKVSVQALDLRIERVAFSTGPFKWPEELLRYPAYKQGSFHQGDRLQVSLIGYRTGSTGISSIRNLGAPSGQKAAAQAPSAR